MLKYWSEDGTSLKAAKRLETTSGSILDFEAVISASTRDRDGDTLLANGAEIDEHAPLLWQHQPDKPIGKLVRVTEKNAKRVCGHFAIADTALGRDAKTLIEFGALRISHGFRPLKAEPQKDGFGHMISAWKCLEISVVSVPSNEAAVVLQHTGGAGLKFYSPEARQLASTLDPEYQRLWQASLGGKSRATLDAEDMYHRHGFKAPWERQHRDDVRLAPTHQPGPFDHLSDAERIDLWMRLESVKRATAALAK